MEEEPSSMEVARRDASAVVRCTDVPQVMCGGDCERIRQGSRCEKGCMYVLCKLLSPVRGKAIQAGRSELLAFSS